MARFLFYDDKLINILLRQEKPSGGAAVQAFGWVKGLTEEGHDVFILTEINNGDTLKDDCKNLKLVPLYNQNKGVRWFRWIYYRLPFLYNTIRRIRPDYLYHIPSWQSFFVGIICHLLGVKYVLRISNDYLLDDRFYKNNSRIHRFFQKMGLLASHCILCQNEYQMQIIRKEFPGKLSLKIPNPIFYKKKTKEQDNNQKSYIAWLGLYQYQKNLPLLYEIACLLKNEQFIIAGKEGTHCDPETHSYLKKLEQLPNVKFAGFLQREQVLPFLSQAKFLLNTSHYEGFSNTFLEAMSVGTPILTSHKVNPDSIISENNLGMVYNDAFELHKAFTALSTERYQLMSQNVQAYVEQQHNYRVLSKKLMSFLSVKEAPEPLI